MNILFSIIFATMLLYIVSLQITFYNEIVRDKYRFRYFALRDELAMLVINNVIEEDSWEYKQIIDTLNFHIQAVDEVSLFRIVRMLSDYHINGANVATVRKMKKKITDEQVAGVLVEFFALTKSLLHRNSKVQMAIVEAFMKREESKKKKEAHLKLRRPFNTYRVAQENINNSLHDFEQLAITA